ncbi:MAG: Eco57I restriction-modification methylase domain-containing protein [Promethearchaeota archaeon]
MDFKSSNTEIDNIGKLYSREDCSDCYEDKDSIISLFGSKSFIYRIIVDQIRSIFNEYASVNNRILLCKNKWHKVFAKVYNIKEVNEQIYFKHAYLSLIIKYVISLIYDSYFYFSFGDKKKIEKNNSFKFKIEWVRSRIGNNNKGMKQYRFNSKETDYFYWLEEFPSLFKIISKCFEDFVEQIEIPKKQYININININEYKSSERLSSTWNSASHHRENLLQSYKILLLLKHTSFLNKIYQDVISLDTRHSLGEFYTPRDLTSFMIEEVYQFGNKTLDPTCGSGIFLAELIKKILSTKHDINAKISAINNIYGFDINPLALSVAYVNILLILIMAYKDMRLNSKNTNFNNSNTNQQILQSVFPFREDLHINLYYHDVFDDLTHDFKKMNCRLNDFDLIIGNPPWIVLNSLYSIEYKNRIKKEAEFFNLIPSGKNIPHIDISSIFIYKTAQYLKEYGKIFFITTAALLTGEQHSKFRAFNGFGDVFVWKFDRDIFRIHSICICLTKIALKVIPPKEKLKIRVYSIKCQKTKNNVKDLKSSKDFVVERPNSKLLLCENDWIFEKKNYEIYVPHNFNEIFESKDSIKDKVARFVPLNIALQLLPYGKSPYFNKFIQGASIVPRSFFIVQIPLESANSDNFDLSNNNEYIIAYSSSANKSNNLPPQNLVKNCNRWSYAPFSKAKFEKKYIYRLIKSSDLVPYALLRYHHIFLPIENDSYKFELSKIMPLAKNHFSYLSQQYLIMQKSDAAIKSLWKRINFHKGLEKQIICRNNDYIIVYAGIGSMIKSAIIPNLANKNNYNIVIDTSLYYYFTNNKNEAYYLLGILNSPLISRDLKYRGSTGANGSLRNIHKNPLKYPFPLYKDNNSLHNNIAKYALQIEEKVKRFIKDYVNSNSIMFNLINSDYSNRPINNSSTNLKKTNIIKLKNKIINLIKDDCDNLDLLIKKLFY